MTLALRLKTQMKVNVGQICAGERLLTFLTGAETFLVFINATTSRNLGMINPKAEEIEVSVGGRTFTIQQSPGLLTSNREAGTTGAGKSTATSNPTLADKSKH